MDERQFGMLGALASIGGMLVSARALFQHAENADDMAHFVHMQEQAIAAASEMAKELPPDVQVLLQSAKALEALAKRVLRAASAEVAVTVDVEQIAKEHGLVPTPTIVAFGDDLVKRVLGGEDEDDAA